MPLAPRPNGVPMSSMPSTTHSSCTTAAPQPAPQSTASSTVSRSENGSSSRRQTAMTHLRVHENGFREYHIHQQKFVLPPRYTPLQRIGSGSYGIVVSARDAENPEEVMAIKRCGNIFAHCEDGKRVLREIKMMSMLEHRNILPIKDVFVSESNFNDVYVVTPKMDTDLSMLIKQHKLSDQHVKYIMYQVLRALKYIHSANVLHRDLKPANVLVNYNAHVKLCDFGLARGYDPNSHQDMTSYIVTRWYRAPELLLRNSNYNGAIDVWAAGCILAEMLIGEPLFCGKSSIEQLRLICDAVALPEPRDMWWVQNAEMQQYLAQIKAQKDAANQFTPPHHLTLKHIITVRAEKSRAVGLKTACPKVLEDPQMFDVLNKMLAFNPRQRWAPEHLLEHRYFDDVRSASSLEPANHVFKWKYDSMTNLTPTTLRQLYWEELINHHPESKFIPNGTRPSSPVALDARREDRA